ncbi:MAG TPA: hypothetical protein VLC09_17100, partial [Polyangiaceae bacterium]|nr:hypothetical protein [Polyangiaceae bacterium]
MTSVDRLRLLGSSGSRKLVAGEFSRLLRRALPREENSELLSRDPEHIGVEGVAYPFSPRAAAVAVTYCRTPAR